MLAKKAKKDFSPKMIGEIKNDNFFRHIMISWPGFLTKDLSLAFMR